MLDYIEAYDKSKDRRYWRSESKLSTIGHYSSQRARPGAFAQTGHHLLVYRILSARVSQV